MIACVLIPDFAASVERQADPALSGAPLILVQYGAKYGKVAAVSAEAREMGVTPGLSLSRAGALCPDGHFRPFDESRCQRAVDAMLQALWTFTNRVEVDEAAYPQSGIFYLDLGRLREADSRSLGEAIGRTLGEQTQLAAAVGLASGKFPAYVAAVSARAGETVFVARDQVAAFVAPYAVSLLPLSKETARRLHILYIRQIGQLAALPRPALVGQFGRAGRLLHQLARGQDPRPVRPRRMPPIEAAARRFEPPLADRARLDVVVHYMASHLADRLEARHSALHEITVALTFEDNEVRAETLHLLQPVASAAGIARTINQLLERAPVRQGITEIEVALARFAPNVPRQLELFTHRPGRRQLYDLARVLAARHGDCFYEAKLAERGSLLPERRFSLRQMEAS